MKKMAFGIAAAMLLLVLVGLYWRIIPKYRKENTEKRIWAKLGKT